MQQQQEKQNDANVGNEGSNNDTEMQDVEVSPHYKRGRQYESNAPHTSGDKRLDK